MHLSSQQYIHTPKTVSKNPQSTVLMHRQSKATPDDATHAARNPQAARCLIVQVKPCMPNAYHSTWGKDSPPGMSCICHGGSTSVAQSSATWRGLRLSSAASASWSSTLCLSNAPQLTQSAEASTQHLQECRAYHANNCLHKLPTAAARQRCMLPLPASVPTVPPALSFEQCQTVSCLPAVTDGGQQNHIHTRMLAKRLL
jgi:hypothetical protein